VMNGETQPARRVDRVALLGVALAAAGAALLPFVLFRENRIVSGTGMPVSVAGLRAWILVVGIAVAATAAVAPARFRSRVGLWAGAIMTASLVSALGAAADSLSGGAGSIARVSVGSGAWLVLVGSLIVWIQGAKSVGRGPERLASAVVVAVVLVLGIAIGGLSELSFAREYEAQTGQFWSVYLRTHVTVVIMGVAFGTLIGVPLGVAATRSRAARAVGLTTVGVIQTIPSLALLGLLIAPLSALGLPSIGMLPAVIALTLYALLPVVRSTFVGLQGVDPAAIDAGRGMGMGRLQLLTRVEVPLALPLVLDGIRQAMVLIIGIAAVVAFIGAPTLGVPLFSGLGQTADDLVLLGALPMVVLAVIADEGMKLVSALVVSPGIRAREEG